MFSTTLVSFTLLSLAAAAPAAIECSGCSTKGVKVDIPTNQTLISPSTLPVTFVAIGLGTQNYTCSSTGTYTNVGAVADIFDISCLIGKPAFNTLPDTAIASWAKASKSASPSSILASVQGIRQPDLLGKHFFVSNSTGAGGISPKWDFTSSFKGNSHAFVTAAKVSSFSSPDGSSNVDWVFLKAVQGKLAQEVYRTDTRAGQPPASCTPGSAPIAVKYVAKYWLSGGSIKA
jgi:hypothetical protein